MKLATVIKYLFVSLVFLLGSCKKRSDKTTTVNFTIINPVTNEPYSGVRVGIIEKKLKGGGINASIETSVVWESKTDDSGQASHFFFCNNSSDYLYLPYIEGGFYDDPSYTIWEQPNYGESLKKNEVNEAYYSIVKKVPFVTWVKNKDCFDSNDKMRYRKRSIVNKWDSNWNSWIPGITGGFYTGCYEHEIQINSQTQNIWDIEMEVTKNGVTTIHRDTFHVTGQNGMDTLKLFY